MTRVRRKPFDGPYGVARAIEATCDEDLTRRQAQNGRLPTRHGELSDVLGAHCPRDRIDDFHRSEHVLFASHPKAADEQRLPSRQHGSAVIGTRGAESDEMLLIEPA